LYNGFNGQEVHFLFENYVATRGVKQPDTRLGTLFPAEFPPGSVGAAFKPDAVNQKLKTFYDLKPYSHIDKPGLQWNDDSAMSKYEGVLGRLGYNRGAFEDIAFRGQVIGEILGVTGKWYTVSLYPQNTPTVPGNFDGTGIILYKLTETGGVDPRFIPLIPKRFVDRIVANFKQVDVPVRVPQPRPIQRLVLEKQLFNSAFYSLVGKTALYATAGIAVAYGIAALIGALGVP
jgi:hypothetical protein